MLAREKLANKDGTETKKMLGSPFQFWSWRINQYSKSCLDNITHTAAEVTNGMVSSFHLMAGFSNT